MSLRWDFSPKGDAVEDDEQNDAPGFEWIFKDLFYGSQALQVKPNNLCIITMACKN